LKVSFAKYKKFLIFLLLLLRFEGASAQSAVDSIETSLLTCSPGTEVYSLYGHTALRVRNYTRNLDLVFNYGVFSFNTPHFVWRFVLGQCDYEVCAFFFDGFLQEYIDRGSSVLEQKLNLTPEENDLLFRNLMVNVLPKNKTYRYNYLTNNCTTKVRDMVESAIDGEVVYPTSPTPRTYRQIIHRFTEDSPWMELGNDLLLGAACDTVLDDHSAMFVPNELSSYFGKAMILDTLGNRRSLVGSEDVLVPMGKQFAEPGFPLRPFVVGVLFALLCLAVALVEYRTRNMWWMLDALLMFLQGIAGCLICFMFFFSEHPTVDSNWQLWVLNPLPLFCIPWVIGKARKGQVCAYHYLNTPSLTLFILLSAWVPQKFAEIIVPLALGLLIRSASYCLNYARNR